MPLENENNLSRAYLENSWYAKRHASETDVTNFLKVLKRYPIWKRPPTYGPVCLGAIELSLVLNRQCHFDCGSQSGCNNSSSFANSAFEVK